MRRRWPASWPKAASGGLEHVAIVSVVNLARALEQLGDMGYLRLGLDSEAEAELRRRCLCGVPSRWCSAARARGCAVSAGRIATSWSRLDMPGAIKSLNVSNACAVALDPLAAGLQPGIADLSLL